MAWLQSKAYVGAKWERSDSDYHYDWSAIGTGDEIPAIADATCTLATTLTDGATTITIDISGALTSDVPASGGVWVKGNGTGQAWEYIPYSGVSVLDSDTVQLTGCVREASADREHNGAHNSGADVKFFWELDTMKGEFTFTEEMDDQETVIDWSADASGWKFPQPALRDGHLFVYLTRTDPADPFTIMLMGFIDARNTVQNYLKNAQWTTKIISSAGMINRVRATGTRRGKFDVARGASVTASPALGAPYKERSGGDYIEAEPNLEASSAFDGERKTLYIADQPLGTEPDHYTLSTEGTPVVDHVSMDDPSIRTNTDVNGKKILLTGAIIFSEIHISLAAGQPQGTRYIEMTVLDDIELSSLLDLYIATDDDAVWYRFAGDQLNGLDVLTAGETIVICENEDMFRDENPSADPTYVIELRNTVNKNFLANLSTTDETIGLYYEWEAQTPHFYHVVTWGSGGTAEIVSANNPSLVTSDITFGTALAAASNGKTYHYNYAADSTAANNWDIGYVQSVGVSLANTVFVQFELPPLGLKLAEAISSSYTGLVRITDGTGDTTGGLDASGSLLIASEIVSYTKSNATQINITARGQGGTSGAAHAKGDPIYVYENSLAVDAYPIKAIEIDCADSSKVTGYTLRVTPSSYPPRTPKEDGYTSDYTNSYSSTNSSATITYTLGTPIRIRHVLLEITDMEHDPARPKVKEIRAVVNEAKYEAETWFSNTTYSSVVAGSILENSGMPAAAITTSATLYSGDHGTANRMTWDVVTELATYAGLFIRVARDSKIEIVQNGYLTGEIFTTDYTWTVSNGVSVEPTFGRPEPIGQVSIPWISPDGTINDPVFYPDVAADGDIFEMPQQVYSDATDATTRARKMYFRKLYPYSWVVESGVAGNIFRPDQIHVLSQWQLHKEMQPVDRLCWVKAVTHSITQSPETHTLAWRAACHLIEIERENP